MIIEAISSLESHELPSDEFETIGLGIASRLIHALAGTSACYALTRCLRVRRWNLLLSALLKVVSGPAIVAKRCSRSPRRPCDDSLTNRRRTVDRDHGNTNPKRSVISPVALRELEQNSDRTRATTLRGIPSP